MYERKHKTSNCIYCFATSCRHDFWFVDSRRHARFPINHPTTTITACLVISSGMDHTLCIDGLLFLSHQNCRCGCDCKSGCTYALSLSTHCKLFMANLLFQLWLVLILIRVALIAFGIGVLYDSPILWNIKNCRFAEYSVFHMADICCLSQFRYLVAESMI